MGLRTGPEELLSLVYPREAVTDDTILFRGVCGPRVSGCTCETTGVVVVEYRKDGPGQTRHTPRTGREVERGRPGNDRKLDKEDVRYDGPTSKLLVEVRLRTFLRLLVLRRRESVSRPRGLGGGGEFPRSFDLQEGEG